MSAAEAPQRLHLDYRLDAGVAVVTVTGEVDVANCELLREGLLRVVPDEHDRGLVANLASVNFMDSTGLGVLVGVWHRLGARHGSLALAAPSRQIQRILDTTGLARVLAEKSSRSSAAPQRLDASPARGSTGARVPGNSSLTGTRHPAAIAVRDSKNPGGPVLTLPAAAWQAFTRAVKTSGLHLT